MKIFVVGSTGLVGSEIVRLLDQNSNHEVLALTRDPESDKAKGITSYKNVRLIGGDIKFPEKYKDFVLDSDLLFLFNPQPSEESPNIAEKFADILQNSSIKHIVWMSEIGCRKDAVCERWRVRWEAEQIISETGIPVTSVMPNFFMQNLLQVFHELKHSNNISNPMPMKNAKFAMIDAKDISRFIFNVLINPDLHANKRYELSGEISYSTEEAILKIGEHAGRKISVNNISLEEYEKTLKEAGLSKWLAKSQIEIFKQAAEGFFDQPSSIVSEVTDNFTTLDQFIEHYLPSIK